MNEPLYIDRPPRIQPELPSDEIEIPPPPEKENTGMSRLIQVALPLLTIVGYILISMVGGQGRSPLMMLPMALSVVASTIFSIYMYRKEKQNEAEIEQAYTDRLVELSKEMNEYHDQQRRFYRYNYPDDNTLFRIVQNARLEVEKPERALRAEARLWERRVEEEDFGVIRLGMGTLPSTVTYVLNDPGSFENPQVRAAMKLEKDSRFVSDIPVIVSLRPSPGEKEAEENEEEEVKRTPAIHALGIAGEQQSVYEFTRATLSHFTVFHAPKDAKLYVLASRKREWAWTEMMPHCQEDEQGSHLCFVEEIREEAAITIQ